MAVTQILQFPKDAYSGSDASTKSADELVQRAIEDLSHTISHRKYTIGAHLQEKSIVQVVSEWDGVEVYKDLEAIPEYATFVETLRTHFGSPANQFHLSPHQSPFGQSGAATANVVEYVQSYFPASTVTPAFEKQIFDDFVKFDEIYMPGTQGMVGLAMGWTQDNQEHADMKGEKAKCFVVIRGWESMGDFEESTKTEEFKEAIPILFSWKAPFHMVRAFSARAMIHDY
jgi:hypothetical protein